MQLYHDIPYCQGVENALKRARRLSQFQYYAIKPLPIIDRFRPTIEKPDSTLIESHAAPWLPLKGILYSSVRRSETYVGYNITPETFVTALSNPNSVMYTDPIKGTGQNVHNRYGIVCSCFVSYSLNIHYRTNCARWPSMPGIHTVDTTELENIKLADVVLNPKSHIAIVTDIERDLEGKVHFITVSESTIPYIRVTRFNPEQFRNYWLANGYTVFRYDGAKDVPYEPDPFAPVEGDPTMPEPFINRSLMPDFGNKANYRRGEQPVVISVFEEGCEAVEITDPDGEKTLWPVEDGFVKLDPDKLGVYEAACVKGEERSASVSFCVTGLIIKAEKEEYALGEKVTLKIDNPAGDTIVAWQFNKRADDKGNGGGWLDLTTEKEVTIAGPNVAVPSELYLIAKNAFGCYTSRRIPLEIKE